MLICNVDESGQRLTPTGHLGRGEPDQRLDNLLVVVVAPPQRINRCWRLVAKKLDSGPVLVARSVWHGLGAQRTLVELGAQRMLVELVRIHQLLKLGLINDLLTSDIP